MPYVYEYLLAFGLFAIVLLSSGFLLQRIFFNTFALACSRLAHIAIGAAFWIMLTFLLFTLHLFHYPLFFITAIGLIVVATGYLVFKDIHKHLSAGFPLKNISGARVAFYWPVSEFAHRAEDLRYKKSHPYTIIISIEGMMCLLALIFVFGIFFIVTIHPSISWDADTYHLTLPKLYIEDHGFRRVAFNVYSNWPLNIEMLFAAAMLMKDYILAKLIHFAFGMFILYEIFLWCREFHQPRCSWLAIPLYLANHVVLFEMPIAYVDLAYTFFFLASLLFMKLSLKHAASSRRYLLLSGLFAGILTGVKINGIVGVAVIAVVYIVQCLRGGHFVEKLKQFPIFLGPVLLLALPWVLKSFWYTGNPVYPFFYQWLGGGEWSTELTTQFTQWQMSIGMGRSVWDYILLPFRVILMGDNDYAHFQGNINTIWIILVPMTLLFGRKNPLVRFCLLASGLYFLYWSLSSQQMRFLIPILPLLAISAAATIKDGLKHITDCRFRYLTWLLFTIVIIFLMLWECKPYISQAYRSLQSYQQHAHTLKSAVIHPVYRFIHQHLPQNARILFLNSNHGFFCEREYLADSFFEASQIADWLQGVETAEDVLQRLQSISITHILFYNRNWNINYPTILFDMLKHERGMKLLYASHDNKAFLFKIDEIASPL